MDVCGGFKPSVYRKKLGIARRKEKRSHVVFQSLYLAFGGEKSRIWSRFGEGADVHCLEKWRIISFSVFLILTEVLAHTIV